MPVFRRLNWLTREFPEPCTIDRNLTFGLQKVVIQKRVESWHRNAGATTYTSWPCDFVHVETRQKKFNRQLNYILQIFLCSQIPVGRHNIRIHLNSTSLSVSHCSFQVINFSISLSKRTLMPAPLICCNPRTYEQSLNLIGSSKLKTPFWMSHLQNTVFIQFYRQHSLQLPWASYVPVSRLRHISMYVFLPSSLSDFDFVSSSLSKMKRIKLSFYIFELPSVYLFLNSVANWVAKFVLYVPQWA